MVLATLTLWQPRPTVPEQQPLLHPQQVSRHLLDRNPSVTSPQSCNMRLHVFLVIVPKSVLHVTIRISRMAILGRLLKTTCRNASAQGLRRLVIKSNNCTSTPTSLITYCNSCSQQSRPKTRPCIRARWNLLISTHGGIQPSTTLQSANC